VLDDLPKAHADFTKLTAADSLFMWHENYGPKPPGNNRGPMFFQEVGHTILLLCRLQLRISITELQDILGKSGKEGFLRAKERLARMFASDETTALHVLTEAAAATDSYIKTLAPTLSNGSSGQHLNSTSALAPYTSIYLFLAHVLFYACGITAPTDLKARLVHRLRGNILKGDRQNELCQTRTLLAASFDDTQDPDAASKQILRHGAQLLAWFDNWGCSSNLALLLNWRSKL
jgi:hypothetical protein